MSNTSTGYNTSLHPFTLYLRDEEAQWIRERARVERRSLERTIVRALEDTEMSQLIQGTVEHVWEPAADGAASKEALDALQAAYYWESDWREQARKVLIAAGRVA